MTYVKCPPPPRSSFRCHYQSHHLAEEFPDHPLPGYPFSKYPLLLITSTTWNDERFLNLFYFPFLIEYKLRGSTELSLSGISLYCRQLAQCLAGGRCLLNICGINSVPPPPTYHLLPLSPRSHHFLPLCLWPSMVTNHPSALP